jgi:hypothetical protein
MNIPYKIDPYTKAKSIFFYGFWVYPETLRDIYENGGTSGWYQALNPDVSLETFAEDVQSMARYYGARK